MVFSVHYSYLVSSLYSYNNIEERTLNPESQLTTQSSFIMIKEISVHHNQVAKAQRDSDDYVLPHRLYLESARADDATESDAPNHDCDVSHEASSSVDKEVATSQKHLDIDDATFMSSITLLFVQAPPRTLQYSSSIFHSHLLSKNIFCN